MPPDFCYQDDNENTAHYDELLDTFLGIYAGQYSYRFAVTPLSQRLVSAIKQYMYESAPPSIKYAVDMERT